MAHAVDYLIVGQGLAGSLLALELIRRRQKVLVVDNGGVNASMVAAGLINPLTGPRIAKTPLADSLWPVAEDYYRELANYFHQPFFIDLPLLRLLADDAERRQAEKRLTDAAYRDYIEGIAAAPPELNSPSGVLLQKRTGYLKTQPLLRALRNFFIEQSSYQPGQVDSAAIEPDAAFTWRDWQASAVIFCDGYRGYENPWFRWLPFRPVKGEMLTLATSETIAPNILNYGQWLLPLDGRSVKIGATFSREDLELAVTASARNELLERLQQVYPRIKAPQVVEHVAGIRPATADRQPLIGVHPAFKRLLIFNGFGAKGSLSIPYYCRCFADFLLQQHALPVQCDIKRFYATHFSA